MSSFYKDLHCQISQPSRYAISQQKNFEVINEQVEQRIRYDGMKRLRDMVTMVTPWADVESGTEAPLGLEGSDLSDHEEIDPLAHAIMAPWLAAIETGGINARKDGYRSLCYFFLPIFYPIPPPMPKGYNGTSEVQVDGSIEEISIHDEKQLAPMLHLKNRRIIAYITDWIMTRTNKDYYIVDGLIPTLHALVELATPGPDRALSEQMQPIFAWCRTTIVTPILSYLLSDRVYIPQIAQGSRYQAIDALLMIVRFYPESIVDHFGDDLTTKFFPTILKICEQEKTATVLVLIFPLIHAIVAQFDGIADVYSPNMGYSSFDRSTVKGSVLAGHEEHLVEFLIPMFPIEGTTRVTPIAKMDQFGAMHNMGDIDWQNTETTQADESATFKAATRLKLNDALVYCLKLSPKVQEIAARDLSKLLSVELQNHTVCENPVTEDDCDVITETLKALSQFSSLSQEACTTVCDVMIATGETLFAFTYPSALGPSTKPGSGVSTPTISDASVNEADVVPTAHILATDVTSVIPDHKRDYCGNEILDGCLSLLDKILMTESKNKALETITSIFGYVDRSMSVFNSKIEGKSLDAFEKEAEQLHYVHLRLVLDDSIGIKYPSVSSTGLLPKITDELKSRLTDLYAKRTSLVDRVVLNQGSNSMITPSIYEPLVVADCDLGHLQFVEALQKKWALHGATFDDIADESERTVITSFCNMTPPENWEQYESVVEPFLGQLLQVCGPSRVITASADTLDAAVVRELTENTLSAISMRMTVDDEMVIMSYLPTLIACAASSTTCPPRRSQLIYEWLNEHHRDSLNLDVICENNWPLSTLGFYLAKFASSVTVEQKDIFMELICTVVDRDTAFACELLANLLQSDNPFVSNHSLIHSHPSALHYLKNKVSLSGGDDVVKMINLILTSVESPRILLTEYHEYFTQFCLNTLGGDSDLQTYQFYCILKCQEYITARLNSLESRIEQLGRRDCSSARLLRVNYQYFNEETQTQIRDEYGQLTDERTMLLSRRSEINTVFWGSYIKSPIVFVNEILESHNELLRQLKLCAAISGPAELLFTRDYQHVSALAYSKLALRSSRILLTATKGISMAGDFNSV